MPVTQWVLQRRNLAGLLPAICAVALLSMPALAQQSPAHALAVGSISLESEAVAPQRFVAVHGRRALVAGYASDSLEVWAYPFQILSGYRVSFLPAGATTPISGADILRRVTYEPGSITRVYVGPDFVVREKLFVPLNEPGAILTYSVEGGKPVDIEVHATPVMNLMWPASVGGQEVAWDPSLSAYLLREPANGYTAVVGSPDLVAHDDVDNRTAHGAAETGFGFTLRAGASGLATAWMALNPPHAADTGLLFHKLIRDQDALYRESEAHYREYAKSLLHVETSDQRVNQAIEWSEIALDQAWVCNPDLGCGYVAGYGPSRGARRPQYDWFFAGDGLVAADAATAAGDTAHARDELKLVLRYQDKKTGMIWHEMSQRAGFLDWAGKYPYMFVHVDITFQFFGKLARHVSATGDAAFVKENWPAIESAYRYCLSVIDPSTGLPRIPPGKEGGDEQDRMSDDLGLSASWVQAADSFARTSSWTGCAGSLITALRNRQPPICRPCASATRPSR